MLQKSEMCISLPFEGCWEIGEGDVDSVQFIDLLIETFPEATTVYIEGTSIESDVKTVFEEFTQNGPYLPKNQTLWPKSECYRCVFSKEFLKKLSYLAQNHADPELLDHLFIYHNETPLMEWPDAFFSYIWLSTEITESRAKAFAGELELSWKYVKDELT